jgi:enoyl-[acyl-carrier protein] reductase I
MSFLNLEGKYFLVAGLANRKSVAWFVGRTLEANGAQVYYTVRSPARREELSRWVPTDRIWVCDVEREKALMDLAREVQVQVPQLDGLVHSIAFANFSEGFRAFHQTRREDFLQAVQISCFSLIEMVRELKPLFAPAASVVTIGISSQVAAVHYGYLSPIKAALESTVRFLAKSFSRDSEVRFNCVGSGPLKTSASAGIPGFLKNYLFAEQLTLRKRALATQEVANVVAFLLSTCSSGINGQTVVVNAGMDFNYFDEQVIEKVIN